MSRPRNALPERMPGGDGVTDGAFLPNRKAAAVRVLADGPLYLGLATDQRTDGSGRLQMWEVTDRGYVRQRVVFGEPVLDDPVVAWVANSERIDFPPWQDDSPQPLRYWFLCTQPDGAPGELVARGDIAPREIIGGVPVWTRPRQGEGPMFLPGDVVLSLGDAEIVEVPV